MKKRDKRFFSLSFFFKVLAKVTAAATPIYPKKYEFGSLPSLEAEARIEYNIGFFDK